MTKSKVNRPAGRHRKIAKRLYELARYERDWKIAECMYGKEVADKLRDLIR